MPWNSLPSFLTFPGIPCPHSQLFWGFPPYTPDIPWNSLFPFLTFPGIPYPHSLDFPAHIPNFSLDFPALIPDVSRQDAGQRQLGALQCGSCGMLYAPGIPEDRLQHLRHHRRLREGLRYLVSLEWAGNAGNGLGMAGKIPAQDSLLEFLPGISFLVSLQEFHLEFMHRIPSWDSLLELLQP